MQGTVALLRRSTSRVHNVQVRTRFLCRDQSIVLGASSGETKDDMLLTHYKNSGPWRLRPGVKTQATIDYAQQADGSVELRKIHAVAI